jgi:hypothetical protein
MKKIPESFTLGSFTFKVHVVSEEEMSKVLDGYQAYGVLLTDQLTIYLQKPDRKLKKSIVMQTFWHEFSHAVLWVMNHKDYSNEKVVDQLGHMLKQFHDTKS